MAKLSRQVGSTSNILLVFIVDTTRSDGGGLTGLLFNSAGLTAYYKRNKDSASVSITLATIATLGTFVSGGFKEVDSTHMPGWYEFHPPDTAYASGSDSVGIHLLGAANMAPLPIEIELTANSNQDGVRGGMSALPNAVAAAAGGLLIVGTGAGSINPAGGSVTTTYAIRKNTALNNFEFVLVQSSDHVTPATGLSVAGQVSIDGAAFVNLTNAVAEVGSGVYKVNLAAADTNGNVLMLKFSASGADVRFILIPTQS